MDRCGMNRRILFARAQDALAPFWFNELDQSLTPSGFQVCRVHDGTETIRRVERGGLAAAVLWEDEQIIDALSLLRIIRSITLTLPCWVVTDDASRHTMQTALGLRAAGVLSRPVGASDLGLALRKRLMDQAESNGNWS